MEKFSHIPVLLNETLDSLNIKPDGIYVDGTLGGAGHSSEIAKRLSEKGRIIGIDQDEDAIKAATERLKPYKARVEIVRDNYENIKNILDDRNIKSVDGILLDLGVSSYQLDEKERGFSYLDDDSELDMRMDRRNGKSAVSVLNSYSKEELRLIFKEYGEEKFAERIADRIVKERENRPITMVGQLNQIIDQCIPYKYKQNGHPSKKVFQALRIEVNRELDVLKSSIDTMIDLLNDSGRLSIITFQSLEDRIVKDKFRTAENPCTCPPDFPVCVCGKVSKGKVITRKPILPTEEEMKINSRSRSAKLRVFERRYVRL